MVRFSEPMSPLRFEAEFENLLKISVPFIERIALRARFLAAPENAAALGMTDLRVPSSI
jgi:hypothetical protein